MPNALYDAFLPRFQRNGVTTSGTYIASVHDEFVSYSIEALETIQKKSSLQVPAFSTMTRLFLTGVFPEQAHHL